MACKEGQFDVVDQFKTFSINLNVQHVNGMTPFDLALSTFIRYSRVTNVLITLCCNTLQNDVLEFCMSIVSTVYSKTHCCIMQ